MARKKRYIVIGILAFFFCISAPLIIFYSLGWRLDFKTFTISQPGIFYFKVFPGSVKVAVNKKIKKTDFFFNSAMVENLSPGKYDVEISKDGFYSWKKKLQISKGEATEAKNIVLFPKNPQVKIVSENIDEIFMSLNGRILILKETDDGTKDWALKMIEPKNGVKSILAEEKDFLAKAGIKSANVLSAEIKEIKFSENERTALIKLSITEKQKIARNHYFLLETDNSPPSLTFLDFLGQNVIKAGFNPINDKKLAVIYSKTKPAQTIMTEADLSLMKFTSVEIPDVLDYVGFAGNYYYLNDSGFIYKADAFLSLPNKMNAKPLDIQSSAVYKIEATSFGVLIKENNALYYLNSGSGEIKKISDNAGNFSLSKGVYKAAYWNNEINVLFLDKENYQPQKKTEEEILIAKYNNKISDLSWLNDFYLVFSVNDQIKIAETDDRDQINVIDLASYSNPKIFWAKTERILYIFSKNSLYSFSDLIP